MISDAVVASWLESFYEDARISNARQTDDDDRDLFNEELGTRFCSDVGSILRLKHNERCRHFYLCVDALGEEGLKRLGYILSQSSSLDQLILHRFSTKSRAEDLWIWAGIRQNRSISKLHMGQFYLFPEYFDIIGPFLVDNPDLTKLELIRCGLLPDGIELVATKLLQRQTDSIVELDLSDNLIRDNDMDMLCTFAKKSRSLRRLGLSSNEIKGKAVRDLAALLASNESFLREIHLGGNPFSLEEVLLLVKSLETNDQLKTLSLEGTDDSAVAKRVLALVCNGSSAAGAAKSNHTISSFGRPFDPTSNNYNAIGRVIPTDFGVPFETHLDDDETKLVRTALRLNHKDDRPGLKARRKIFWRHMRGDFHVGDDSIDISLMPRVISLVGHVYPCVAQGAGRCDACHKATAQLLCCQENGPRPEQSVLERIRLEAVYRILRARPELCLKEKSAEEKLRAAREENRMLRLENETLREENERLRSQQAVNDMRFHSLAL
ncbi:hypothetical protein ACHAXT_009234 [Thalassiosira profunda]